MHRPIPALRVRRRCPRGRQGMLKYFACKPGKYAIDKTELCRQMMIHRPAPSKGGQVIWPVCVCGAGHSGKFDLPQDKDVVRAKCNYVAIKFALREAGRIHLGLWKVLPICCWSGQTMAQLSLPLKSGPHIYLFWQFSNSWGWNISLQFLRPNENTIQCCNHETLHPIPGS